MRPDHTESAPESSEPTLNGRRLRIDELNLGADKGPGKRENLPRRLLRGVSLFLAGMYTGESCAGTPHGERKSKATTARTSHRSDNE